MTHLKNPNLNLRQRVIAMVDMADDGFSMEFSPLEAKLAGAFVEDALSTDDIEACNDEEKL
jgi:hypothetical protein